MQINRNDICPCGSGKKYKKCCMQKDNIIDLHSLKEKRFYEEKHVLTTKVIRFLYENLSRQDVEDYERVFEERTNNKIERQRRDTLFPFFLVFIQVYNNGLRGMEWFYKEQANGLVREQKELAKVWTDLNFQLIQVIEVNDNYYTMWDVMTNEKYIVPIVETNVPNNLTIGYGTIALLEEFNGKHYFNGVRVFTDYKYVLRVKAKVKKIMKEENLSYGEVMRKYTLELMTLLVNNEKPFEYKKEDIPLLRELHLEHLPFYTADFVDFYKEKTKGKKGNTVRKYFTSLCDLNLVLKENGFVDLRDLDMEDWNKVLTLDYFNMFETMTKKQITDMISTLKLFFQWLKQKGKSTDAMENTAAFLTEEENQLIKAVELPYVYDPSIVFRKMLSGKISDGGKTVEGLFQIIRKNKQSFRVQLLKSNNRDLPGKEFTVACGEHMMRSIEVGIIFSGAISKGNINMWEMLKIEFAYPRSVEAFL
ncbi:MULTISPECIES: SEC-C metal-binding domain-containing protein [Sutcliffiella]|uniref:SEC-C metal-binding domain-containing protein n=1 Tax=Sutcliffiella TaxID=2837511 RepID=UPI0022DE5F20|nr:MULTISPECIES: SEC-C metal-binding domain-containing protein [Sutcliffiella]MED4017679.1 SEC-C metal-binding domain-containing protein [Sutcliffiella cohnii]WBL16782.1 SEC-C metal-binding domain-containing protein [Sutcliffiella sp. NC1]